jgi:hypothetical protein
MPTATRTTATINHRRTLATSLDTNRVVKPKITNATMKMPAIPDGRGRRNGVG